MIFPYKYVNHSMEKMQEFIDFVFYEVWYTANNGVSYSFDLYNRKPELKKIIIAFHYADTIGGDLFNKTLEEVYAIFQILQQIQKDQLYKWYK